MSKSSTLGWLPLTLSDVNMLIRAMGALSITSLSSDPVMLKRRDGLTERLKQKARFLAEPRREP